MDQIGNPIQYLMRKLELQGFCDHSCEFCVLLSNNNSTTDEDMVDYWQKIMEKAHYRALQTLGCLPAQMMKRCLSASTVSLKDFCPLCQMELGDMSESCSSFECLPLKGALKLTDFEFNRASVCKKHNIKRFDIQCLGDVPEYLLISVDSSHMKQLVLSASMNPLRIVMCSNGDMEASLEFSQSLFGKCFYIANPCYFESLIGVKASVVWMSGENWLVHFSEESNTTVLRASNRWSLLEAYHSRPYQANTGRHKILCSITSSGGFLSSDMSDNIFPAMFNRGPNGERLVIQNTRSFSHTISTGSNSLRSYAEVATQMLSTNNNSTQELEIINLVSSSDEENIGNGVENPATARESSADFQSQSTVEYDSPLIEDQRSTPDNVTAMASVIPATENESTTEGLPTGSENQSTAVYMTGSMSTVRNATGNQLTAENERAMESVIPAVEIPSTTVNISDDLGNVVNASLENEENEIDDVESEENDPFGYIPHIPDHFPQLPFLSASYAYLEHIGVRNRHYEPEEEISSTLNKLDIQQARSLMASDDVDCFTTGLKSSETISISYAKHAILSSSFDALHVNVDIDSIDIISFAWLGNVIQGARVRLLGIFNPSCVESRKYLSKGSNFVLFDNNPTAYPGQYFYPYSFPALRKPPPEKEDDPMALTILHLYCILSPTHIRVRALIPSQCVQASQLGQRSMISLFCCFVNCTELLFESVPDTASTPGLSKRQMTSRFFWFCLKELINYFLSFISRNANFNPNWTSLACCSIPCGANSEEHDRSKGHGSSYETGIDLIPEEVVACFQLAVRFFSSIEEYFEVPNFQRCVPHEIPDRNPYLTSIDLQSLNLPQWVIQVLDYPISQVAEYKDIIQRHMWGANVVIAGGMIHLDIDDSRRGPNALPGVISNEQACERKYLNLADMLVFAPTLFRITKHGMKKDLYTVLNGKQIANTIEKELNLSGIHDGVMDISYTLSGPKEKDWGICFPSFMAKYDQLIHPVNSNRIKGQPYSAKGYPDFVGYSTTKCVNGDELTAFDATGIRRLKVYSTSRAIDATRGETVYDTSSKMLEIDLKDTSSVETDWMVIQHERGRGNTSKAHLNEKRRESLFLKILHDISRRKLVVGENRHGFGIRFELTNALDTGIRGLKDALSLLEISEKRKQMTTEEFKLAVSQNPYDWPWFTAILSPNSDRNTFASVQGVDNSDFIPRPSLIPVTILKAKDFQLLCIEIESLLVSKAMAIYNFSNRYVTVSSNHNTMACNKEFRLLLGSMPQGSGIQMSLILIRSLLSCASLFLNGKPCSPSDQSIAMPPFILNSTGLDATYFIGGCPQVLWSRVLSLRQSYTEAAIACSNDSQKFQQIKEHLNTTELSITGLVARLDSDLLLPGHMRMSISKQNDHFYPHVFGSAVNSRSTQAVTSPNALREIHCLLQRLFYSNEKNEFEDIIRSFSALVAVLLMSDTCNELEKILGLNAPSRNRNAGDVHIHDGRIHLRPTQYTSETLGEMVRDNMPWPDCFRIDRISVRRSRQRRAATTREIMNDLIGIYNQDAHGILTLKHLGEETVIDGVSEDDPIVMDFDGLDSDGAMLVSNFIDILFKWANSLPMGIQLLYEMRGSSGQVRKLWKSIATIRIFQGMVDDEERKMRSAFSAESVIRRGSLREQYATLLPNYLKMALKCAGFYAICPLLRSDLSSLSRRPWGPMLNFTVLRDDRRSVRNILSFQPNMLAADNCRMKAATNWLQKLREFKTIYMTEGSSSRRSGTAQMHIGKLFKHPGFVELVIEHLLLMRKNIQEEITLNDESMDYVVRVLESILNIRALYGDEGIALCKGHGEVFSIRDENKLKIKRNLEASRISFPTATETFKNPWKHVSYPKATKLRHGAITKKIVLKRCAVLLYRSKLAFKIPVINTTESRKGHFKVDRLSKLTVRQLFRKYRILSEDEAMRSRSMWRLKDSEFIVMLMMDFCKRQLRNPLGTRRMTTQNRQPA